MKNQRIFKIFIPIFTIIILFMITSLVMGKNFLGVIGFMNSKEVDGYTLKTTQKYDELDATVYVYEHIKTGAPVVYMENQDKNKYFSIGFRTPSQNSTGVAHIIEHSVLGGSEKYPVKDLFNNLSKGSLSTYLNASTYDDMTLYPVASINDKDFSNLVDMYLNTVFYPRIYSIPEIFYQEGWRYEYNEEKKKLEYVGVVFNEMKGSTSSVGSQVSQVIKRSLLLDSPHIYNAGGEPVSIVDLSYEDFLKFHKDHYYPSNALTFFYGDLNIRDHLKKLDRDYFSKFSKKDPVASRPVKAISSAREISEFYMSKTQEKGETYLLAAYYLNVLNNTDRIGIGLLMSMLTEMESSPLRRNLINSGLVKDFSGWTLDTSFHGGVISFHGSGSDPEKMQDFKKILLDTLIELAEKGIDPDLMTAIFNRSELILREINNTEKAISFHELLLSSWKYTDNILTYLGHAKEMKDLREKAKTGYFSSLIKKYILDNNHASFIILKPSTSLEGEKEKLLAEKLAKFQKGLDNKGLEDIIANAKKVKAYSTFQDPEENLKVIPLLELSDIDKKAQDYSLIKSQTEGIDYLGYDIFTADVFYSLFYFNLYDILEEDIPYISLLAAVLKKLNTETNSFEVLDNRIDSLGRMSFGADVVVRKNDPHSMIPRFVISLTSLKENLASLSSLTSEIISKTNFNDKKRFKEIVDEYYVGMKSSLASRGMTYAITRVKSYLSPGGYYFEKLSGLSFYRFIKNLSINFDKEFPRLLEKLTMLSSKIFSRENLTLAFVAPKKDYAIMAQDVKGLVDTFHTKKMNKVLPTFKVEKKNEAFIIPGQVSFVAMAGLLDSGANFSYKGTDSLLAQILGNGELYEKIRLLGGAYGAYMSWTREGLVSFYSYRDPKIAQTINTYKSIPKYIENLSLTPLDLRRNIIGTIAGLDMPMIPISKGSLALDYYFRGVEQDEIQDARDEILNASLEDLKSKSDLIQKVIDQDTYTVFGNASMIENEENKKLFLSIEKVD